MLLPRVRQADNSVVLGFIGTFGRRRLALEACGALELWSSGAGQYSSLYGWRDEREDVDRVVEEQPRTSARSRLISSCPQVGSVTHITPPRGTVGQDEE
jgi:hypothetical protein